MLPASQLEKMLSAIIQASIFIPAILIIAFGLLLLIFSLISPQYQSFEPNAQILQKFFKHIFNLLQVQSLVFLGMFWFKGNKILKMIVTVIAVTVLLITAGFILAKHDGSFLKWVLELENNKFLDFLADYGKTILAILFPLLPWTIAFFRFRKTQICRFN